MADKDNLKNTDDFDFFADFDEQVQEFEDEFNKEQNDKQKEVIKENKNGLNNLEEEYEKALENDKFALNEAESFNNVADIDDEVAEIDRQWEEMQQETEKMAKEEADKRIREIYERAHRKPQYQHNQIKINDVEVEIVSPDDKRLYSNNAFEMERERESDYNNWKTFVNNDNSSIEEAQSETSGFETSKSEDDANSSAQEILNRQNKLKPIDKNNAENIVNEQNAVDSTSGIGYAIEKTISGRQTASETTNASSAIEDTASSIGSSLFSSVSREQKSSEEEQNRQAKSVIKISKKVLPTIMKDSEDSLDTGSSRIKVNGKKVSAAGTIEGNEISEGKINDNSISYNEETGRTSNSHIRTTVDSKHIKGSDTIEIVDSNEAIKRRQSINEKGNTLIIKDGDKLKIMAHEAGYIDKSISAGTKGILISKQDVSGIISKNNGVNSKDEILVGSQKTNNEARKSLRTGNATQEYYKNSAAKDGAIKLNRDGTTEGGRANELFNAVEDNGGRNSRLITGSTRRSKKIDSNVNARIEKMNIGRGVRINGSSTGGLASYAEDAQQASRQSLRFRKMWGLGLQSSTGIEEATSGSIKNAATQVIKTAAKKVLTASLVTTVAIGAGTVTQMSNNAAQDKFSDIYYLPQAHISTGTIAGGYIGKLDEAITRDSYVTKNWDAFSMSGNPFQKPQCTYFAWSRFYQVYGFDSGARGNGKTNASEIVQKHKDKFVLSSVPAPGAVFSYGATATEPQYGHVGFVEAFDGTYIWISEGNVSFGGSTGNIWIHKTTWAAFKSAHWDATFAVPKDYDALLKDKVELNEGEPGVEEYIDNSAPVMTQNALTKMGQRLNAYQSVANGENVSSGDSSTEGLHDIKITSANLNGSSIDLKGFTFKNLKNFTTNYTYEKTTTYPEYTVIVDIPEDERDPDGKTTKEVVVPAETRTATKQATLSTSNVSVMLEFDDKDGNPINIGSGMVNIGSAAGEDITATGEAGKIIEAAKKRVGGKYQWDGNQWGNGPLDTVVDSSHYVWHVLKEAGVYNGKHRTAVNWKTVGRPVESLEKAQAGDVIVYGDHHVAIYDGNGYIYEARGSQWGITHDRKADYEIPYCIRRFAADGASISVGGVVVNDTPVSSPGTNISTTSGNIITVSSGLGRYFTYMGWQCIENQSSAQYKLREETGMKFDNEGFGIINNRYVIACTEKYGQVGDLVDFYQSDGTILHCVIGDIKNQNDYGCNEWGHYNGQCIIEFIVNKDTWYGSGHANPGNPSCHPEWGGKYITKAVNYGSLFNGASGATEVSTSSAIKHSNAKTYFLKEILAMSVLGGYYASPSDVEKYNKYCFDILDYAVADWKGAEVSYSVKQTGSMITLNDGRSDVETPEMELVCNVKVHVCTDLKTLEENDKNFGGAWDLDATANGDPLPNHYMQLNPEVFDLIFNVNTVNTIGSISSLSTKEKEIYEFFSKKGLNNVSIAGILANVSKGSSFNPEKVNSYTGASGLFQWQGERLETLKKYASSKNVNWKNKQCQLEFAWAEMSGKGSVSQASMPWNQSQWSQFQLTTDPYEAGSMFSYYWGKSKDASEDHKRGSLAEEYYKKITGGGGTAYLQWALEIAADDSHGYSQMRRNGNPDYDCSSLVYYSLYNTGWPIASICSYAFSTHTMDSVLTQLGFQRFTFSSPSELIPGDILLRDGHTEIYVGNGQTVGAHCDENGGIQGNLGGDQTGNEISVIPFGEWSVAYRASDSN